MENSLSEKGKGMTRRVFINRSVGTAGGVILFSQAKTWPAWAGEGFEGRMSRMGRIAADPESGLTFISYLDVDMKVREIDTEHGPTRVTESLDRVMVKSRGVGRYGTPVDLSAGQPDAKMDPRIDAAGGRACVVWCGCDPETRQWRIYAAYSRDGHTWSAPMVVAGGERPALHPSVALDRETGQAWVAFEDWSDYSIKLIRYDGSSWKRPLKISEGGRNFRPKVIVTGKSGRNAGTVAVAWDSYRDYQYDIFMRMLSPAGELGVELRVTRSGRWDNSVDMVEDHDGNIWLAWIRASNELSDFDSNREMWVAYFDGKDWRWPMPAEDIPPGGKGRITCECTCWHPNIVVDRHNRVHLFWRQGKAPLPPLLGDVMTRAYEGNRWTRPRKINVSRGRKTLHLIDDISFAVNDRDMIVGVWDAVYLQKMRLADEVGHARPSRVRGGRTFRVEGTKFEDAVQPGWSRREVFKRPLMKIDGRTHTLLFGDTHTHSWTSDGADPADWYYHFARDYARLDFFALSDHDIIICGTPGLEAYISFLPKAFSQRDFICFQAYEFTSQAVGHRVVLFEGDDKPTIPMAEANQLFGDRTNSNIHLYSFLHRFDVGPDSRVMVTAHNMFRVGNDFNDYDESLEPLYDATSLHIPAEKPFTEYEMPESMQANTFVPGLMGSLGAVAGLSRKRSVENKWFMGWRQALDIGLPLGAYGNSDTHAANAIGYCISAVWSAERTRKALFDAMFARRSLALDGMLRSTDIWNLPFLKTRKLSRLMLQADIRFYLDDHFMGSRPGLDKPPTARAVVYNSDVSDPVRAVVFVKDGKEVHTSFCEGGNPFTAEWRDDAWSRGRHYYYVRVEFKSGSLGFSSPVFAGYPA